MSTFFFDLEQSIVYENKNDSTWLFGNIQHPSYNIFVPNLYPGSEPGIRGYNFGNIWPIT